MKIRRLNQASWLICTDDVRLMLHPTPQQSRILDALARAWPSVCTRDTLHQALVSQVEYQQVCSAIAGLRKKGFEILTVHGHGYKIMADQILL